MCLQHLLTCCFHKPATAVLGSPVPLKHTSGCNGHKLPLMMQKEGELDPKTVFIRGLSYDLVSEDVEKAFSEIGPVRKCFLLQGKSHHKVQHATYLFLYTCSRLACSLATCADTVTVQGCGFVSFALAEDARRAAKELDGSQLGNRAIQALPLCSLACCLGPACVHLKHNCHALVERDLTLGPVGGERNAAGAERSAQGAQAQARQRGRRCRGECATRGCAGPGGCTAEGPAPQAAAHGRAGGGRRGQAAAGAHGGSGQPDGHLRGVRALAGALPGPGAAPC